MILFLYGEDTFRSRRYLEQSIEKFRRERDPAGYNVVRLDAKKTEPSRIFAEIASAPFLAVKRLIVVENVLSLSDKEAMHTLQEKIENNRVPDSNVVIFWQAEAVGKTKEAKATFEKFKAEKFAQEFALLTPDKVLGWIKKEIEDRGGAITPAALSYLSANSGGDLWLADGLISQLVAYAHGRAIEIADVQLFLEEKLDDNVFAMVEALVNGRQSQTMKLLYEQRRLGQDDFQIFNLLVWQFRTLLTVTDMLEREPGMPSEMVAQKTGLHPFVVKKNLVVARRFSTATLVNIFNRLQQMDLKTKTGQGDQSVMLDMFVATL